MTKRSALDRAITEILTQRSRLSEDDTFRLQILLHAAGHNKNYSKYGADGDLGKSTLRDVADYLRKHSDLRDDLSPELRQGLLRNQLFGAFKTSAAPVVARAVPVPEIKAPVVSPKASPGAGIISSRDISAAWAAVEGRAHTESSATYRTSKPLIVLDPGHGAGHDRGARSRNGLFETDVVDPLALATARHLRANGYDVAFTRTPGEDFRYGARERVGSHRLHSLGARAQFALALADVTGHSEVRFLSLHADAAGNERASGSSVYAAAFGKRNGRKDFGLPAMDRASETFAASIGEAFSLSGTAPARRSTLDIQVLRDFDSKKGRHGVHGEAGLLEIGFLTNAHDVARMKGMIENPDAAGRKIAAGIMNFERGHDHTHTQLARGLNPLRSVA